MAARASIALILFGIVNLLIALLAPCAGCVGMAMTFTPPALEIEGRDLGPEYKAHIERRVPGAKVLAVLSMLGNTTSSLLLAIGAVGLFMGQRWGRNLTVSGAGFLLLFFCIHDAVQAGLWMPATSEFLDLHLIDLPQEERAGYKFGYLASAFSWTCVSALLMVYLGMMSIYLCLVDHFQAKTEKRKRSRDDDD
jgi:hypothetical protein